MVLIRSEAEDLNLARFLPLPVPRLRLDYRVEPSMGHFRPTDTLVRIPGSRIMHKEKNVGGRKKLYTNIDELASKEVVKRRVDGLKAGRSGRHARYARLQRRLGCEDVGRQQKA